MAEEFAKARYFVDQFGKIKLGTGEKTHFGKNAGAVEISEGRINKTPIRNNALSDPTIFDRIQKKSNPKGHTERIMLRDSLEELIPDDVRDIFIPSKPSKLSRSNDIRDFDKEILSELDRQAPIFKKFFDVNKNKVKLLSERKPCSQIDGGCNTFLDRVLPKDSVTGFLSESFSTENIKKESGILAEAYQKYYNFITQNNTNPRATQHTEFSKPELESIEKFLIEEREKFNDSLVETPSPALSSFSPNSSFESIPLSSLASHDLDKRLKEKQNFSTGLFEAFSPNKPITPQIDHRQGKFDSTPIPFNFEVDEFTLNNLLISEKDLNPERHNHKMAHQHRSESAEKKIDETHDSA